MSVRPVLALLGFLAFAALSPAAHAQFDAASLSRIAAPEPAAEAQAEAPAAAEQPAAIQPPRTGRAGRRAEAGRAAASGVRAIIAKHAAIHGVPAALADAVARVESRYNPRAAHAGNLGLMQIRLQTARSEGYAGSAQGLLDADTNASFGVKHLARAYRMANGDTCGAIMRYQGGLRTTRMSAGARAYCARVKAIMAGEPDRI